MTRVKRILVPTDFSPTSDIALNYAIDMAVREGASIHIVHVLEDAMYAAAYPDGMYVELPGLREKLIEAAKAKLGEAANKCSPGNVAATTQVLAGPPAASITGEANTVGTDLIIMGTHGRSGLAHFMLGSVAERVLRTAQCPVLTVRDTSRAADLIAAEAVSKRQTVGA